MMNIIDKINIENNESTSRLEFTNTGSRSRPVWDRYITLDGERIFHIGNICGTCHFFFRNVSKQRISSIEISNIRSQLNNGLNSINEECLTFKQVLPRGNYFVALFSAFPKMVRPDTELDYFSNELRLSWYKIEDNRQFECYYRGESFEIEKKTKSFEFFIPLYSPNDLNPASIKNYIKVLSSGTVPTAVSLSVLDIKTAMLYPENENGEEIDPEYKTHWCFANYLIDGHHKVFASHLTGKPITVLCFINIENSFQGVEKLINIYQDRR